MSTFTPPIDSGIVPNSGPDAPRMVQRCLGHFSRGSRGRNVFLLTDGTVLENTMPPPTYNADGTVATFPENRVRRFFQGGVSHSINAAESALLTAAGYGSYIT